MASVTTVKKRIPDKFCPQTTEHRHVYPTNIPMQITMLDLSSINVTDSCSLQDDLILLF